MGVTRGLGVQDVAGQVHSSECPGGLAHSQGSVGSWSSEPRVSLHTSLQVILKHLLPAYLPFPPYCTLAGVTRFSCFWFLRQPLGRGRNWGNNGVSHLQPF